MASSSDPIDSLFWDKVARARAMSPEARLLAGGELFDYTRAICIAGIRQQHPNATEEEVRELFRRRLRLARQLENHMPPGQAMRLVASDINIGTDHLPPTSETESK